MKNHTFRISDLIILSALTIFATLQPYYLHHEIIMMETGIHLPAINALFHGQVPYRDFFFLRGPLELYVPFWAMAFLGPNSAILPAFYYAGTVITFLLCVLIAGNLYRTRLILYLMIPVLIARTFPRISYYYWGGMRYAIGFLALWLGLLFFKTGRRRWIFLAGAASCLALLTSIESGACTVPAFAAAFVFAYFFKIQDRQTILKSAGIYLCGFFFVLLPYLGYLIATDALVPLLQSMFVVIRFNHVAYPGVPGVKPETILDFMTAFYPGSRYFKYMTPAFCFMFFAGYLVWQIKKKRANSLHAFCFGLMVYGLVLYAAAFRKIEGHHFEMALQAEKFLLFFLFEEIYLYFKGLKAGLVRPQINFWGNVMVIVFITSSLGYAYQRFDHRFASFKFIKKEIFHQKVRGLSLLENEETETLQMERINGMTVPRWQAEEIKGVVQFLKENSGPQDFIFSYPEVGNFNFYADRPFVGRFPITTFTWMYEPWHRELVMDFKRIKPKYVVMTNPGHRTFPAEWYFRNPRNRDFFNELTELILVNYKLKKTYDSVSIYELK